MNEVERYFQVWTIPTDRIRRFFAVSWMYSTKAGEMSTATTLPPGFTASEKSIVNKPVPAPMSATVIPGFTPAAATMSARLTYTSRRSLSNDLFQRATSVSTT